MNTNFETFTNYELQTKTVNGLTLVLDPDLNKYVLPVETKAGKRILYDDATNQFIEVLISNGGFIYRERTGTGDGIDLTERIFVSANGTNPTPAAIDEITSESIAAGKLKFQKQMIDAANGAVPLFYLGTVISIVVFFWQLISHLDVIVAAIAAGSTAAMTEVGYFFAWLVGGAVFLFVLFRGVPLIFRFLLNNESDDSDHMSGGSAGDSDANVTNIYINNAKNVTGGVGNGTSAQDFINNRKM